MVCRADGVLRGCVCGVCAVLVVSPHTSTLAHLYTLSLFFSLSLSLSHSSCWYLLAGTLLHTLSHLLSLSSSLSPLSLSRTQSLAHTQVNIRGTQGTQAILRQASLLPHPPHAPPPTPPFFLPLLPPSLSPPPPRLPPASSSSHYSPHSFLPLLLLRISPVSFDTQVFRQGAE